MKNKFKRLPDWRGRLQEYILSVQDKPFSWKDNDCGRFTANAVRAMTGKDPMEGMRSYRTEEGAKKVLKEHGYDSAVDHVKKLFKKVPLREAMPGDIAVTKGNILGIVQGPSFIYQPGGVLARLEDAKAIYRVEM